MRGKVLIGDVEYESGPNNQRPALKLSNNLEELGFKLTRFKTGTPPRVISHSIDYSKTESQPGDENPKYFSYETKERIVRSEEHTSELQSRGHLVCRLLLGKK